jgi:exodeoxyribonuclease VII large subunit
VPDDLSLDLFGDVEGAPAGDPAPEPTPADRQPKVWSVYQVNRAVRGLLEDSVEPLWVGGEIGGWTRSRAGHRYFTLKDDRAQLRAVMFARDAEALPADPDEGTKVRGFGDLTLYEARGEYQFVVRRLEAEGADGLWRIAFEKLRSRLEAEGLLAAARKRPLPAYPSCIGVVTSPTGAAFRDIVSVLRRRAPWTRLVLRGAKVQGEGAAVEIARALDDLVRSGLPDVIIVGRGGGSVEDLWAFNEEPVARAIAACPVPVVSAVGHEVDVTISDLVADLRAPTPSAAAEAVAPDAAVLLTQLGRMPARLEQGLRRGARRQRARVEGALDGLTRGFRRRVDPMKQSLDLGLGRLERRARALTSERRSILAACSGKLEALSPLGTLARGYAVARTREGRVLKARADFPPGLEFRLRVLDGTVIAQSGGIEGETADE